MPVVFNDDGNDDRVVVHVSSLGVFLSKKFLFHVDSYFHQLLLFFFSRILNYDG